MLLLSTYTEVNNSKEKLQNVSICSEREWLDSAPIIFRDLNDIPVVEDLLTTNTLLQDIDIVDGNIIGELAWRSVQKYENTVGLLRYTNHKFYVSNINAVFMSFHCSNCDNFFQQNIQFWTTFDYMHWTSDKSLSLERISNPRNCFWQAGIFWY